MEWLRAFCPRGEALTMPDGREFSIETALPYDVFWRELRMAASGKAAMAR